jgi:hypothetical protein
VKIIFLKNRQDALDAPAAFRRVESQGWRSTRRVESQGKKERGFHKSFRTAIDPGD